MTYNPDKFLCIAVRGPFQTFAVLHQDVNWVHSSWLRWVSEILVKTVHSVAIYRSSFVEPVHLQGHLQPMALCYKSTFIDVEDEATPSIVRRNSEPPRQRQITEEEEEGREHVRRVAREMNWDTQSQKEGFPKSSPQAAEINMMSSLGHPVFCMPRCIFLAAGRCRNGEACGFCHLTHEEPRPKKAQRRMLGELPKVDLLMLVISSLQMKVRRAEQKEEVLPVEEPS